MEILVSRKKGVVKKEYEERAYAFFLEGEASHARHFSLP